MTTEQNIITEENEQLLEEMLLDAQEAQGPQVEQVVNRPGSESPLPMTAQELGRNQWVYVWHRFTGDRSLCNRNMLGIQLDKRENDPASPNFGQRVFVTRDPGIKPPTFHTLCWLHKDHPQRDEWDKIGLPYCPAAHLRNDYNARLHMQHRHGAEWAAIQEEDRRVTEEEERQVRHALIRANTPAPETPVAVEEPEPAPPPRAVETCPDCDGEISAKSRKGINLARLNHKKKCPAAS